MKKFSQFIKEAKRQLEIQDDTINYISAPELKKYKEIADKFISPETKEIIQYLIVNNSNYINDLGKGEENALAYFYNNGPYKDQHKKELYALIGKVAKSNRLLEIPVFQTPEQFKSIVSGEVAPDEVIMDLTSEQGRSLIAKKYEKLCYKIALSFKDQTTIPFEDLLSQAYVGLTYAMNGYGKKSEKAKKKEQEMEEEMDISTYKKTTFLTFASYCIRYSILDSIKNDAHLVRIPVNKQAEERKEKGYNTKNHSISGDKPVGGEEKGKSLFDYVGGMENAGKSVDDEDIATTWKILLKIIKESDKFSEKMISAWIQFNQLNGNEKKKNKEIAAELGITPSNVTYYCYCINSFIKKDPKASKVAKELIVLYNESLQRYYEEDDREECHSIRINEKNNEDNE